MTTSLIVTSFVLLMILGILFSLGSGLVFLIRDQGKTKRTVQALTFRIVLSFILFLLLLLAYALGWITPHGILLANT